MRATERERIVLSLLDQLTELGFDMDDCIFSFDPELGHWIVSDAEHAEFLLSQTEHAEP